MEREKTDSSRETDAEVIQRRDEAVRRALNTPPKLYKDSKVGETKAKPSRKR